jgi:excinuclease UvrABC helicase subunit UvrB
MGRVRRTGVQGSATPPRGMEQTGGVFIKQIIPPHGPRFDPMIRPSTQVDVMDEIRRVTAAGYRTLSPL